MVLISRRASGSITRSGSVAQWIEHPPSKRVVAGSNPARSVPPFHWKESLFYCMYDLRGVDRDEC